MSKRPIVVLLCAALAVLGSLPVPAQAAATEMTKITPFDQSAGDQFGSVSLDGDTALIGAHADDDRGFESGSAYVFGRTGSGFAMQAKLRASDGQSADHFGQNLELEGDTAVIGAHLDDDRGFDAGSAYVFAGSGETWTQQTKLRASDGSSSDWFGSAVSISGDSIAVGAQLDDPVGTDSGAVYVFTRTGSVWTEQAKIVPSDGAAHDHFGNRVVIDGDTLLVTAILDDDRGFDAGSAYVFVRSGSTWTQQAKLTGSTSLGFDNFGVAADLDGDRAIVGAHLDDDLGTSSGAVFVFERAGSVWTQAAKLYASDGEDGDEFGVSVALDGDRAMIGTRGDDTAGTDVRGGSARLFVHDGSTWTEDSVLVSADVAPHDSFGHPVAIDGAYALLSALGDDDGGTDSGSVYVFTTSIPLAVDDVYTVAEDGNLPVLAPGVLANDADPEGDPLVASLVTGPTSGSLGFNPDGSFVYVPDADFNGTDTFTYAATDPGGAVSWATVTLVVQSVNDGPRAIDDAAATPQYEPIAIEVLANDTDTDGDALSVADVTQGAEGSVAIDTEGTVTYSPGPAFRGTDEFTYTVTDGSATTIATVTVTELGCANGEVEDGPVSSVVDGVEPVAGSVVPEAAQSLHEINCTVVASNE